MRACVRACVRVVPCARYYSNSVIIQYIQYCRLLMLLVID